MNLLFILHPAKYKLLTITQVSNSYPLTTQSRLLTTMLKKAFESIVFYPFKDKFWFLSLIHFVACSKCFNLDQSKNLPFDRGLKGIIWVSLTNRTAEPAKHDKNTNISMGESNTVVSAYTMYRHLQQYCSHPSKYVSLSYYTTTSTLTTNCRIWVKIMTNW